VVIQWLFFWMVTSASQIRHDGKIAIECKISSIVEKRDFKGLIAFANEHHPERSILVCMVPIKRIMRINDVDVDLYPFEQFLKELWDGQIINKS
jgi:hypothetical protein